MKVERKSQPPTVQLQLCCCVLLIEQKKSFEESYPGIRNILSLNYIFMNPISYMSLKKSITCFLNNPFIFVYR